MKVWKLARGLIARGAAAGAEILADRGFEEHGKTLARWGMLVGGVAFVIEAIENEHPSADELRGVFWTLGQELERMGDSAAAGVWLTLAEQKAESFNLDTLKVQCGDAMEDASLEAAAVMAPVWQLLERLGRKAPC